jgi:hypothetical protein
MNTKFILLPTILLLVVPVSGCTGIPGLEGLCIPGFGTCGQTVEYENDVLVITTLDAVPSTISTGQQFRLSAWIENRGGETVPQKDFSSIPVKIRLYDACEGLFKSIKVTCPEKEETEGDSCEIEDILPKQKVPIFWTLTAYDEKKIPLQTSCNLKVYVQYPYRTKSITSITFVDYVEYQRMINEGKFSVITSYITEGYGPIKPYLTSEDQQPIPVRNGQESTTTIAFQIKNKGSGFLASLSSDGEVKLVTEIKIPSKNIEISSSSGESGDKITEEIRQNVAALGDIQLIGKESPKQHFTIKTPYDNRIEKIATYYVSSSVDYMYEFRKEIKVTIKPPSITG